ncbi:Clavaminate synthase-like protein [Cerioporus squamosus]|nr:Clavaminate synthase-like protein [Cerioporus squamosus]
MHHSPATLPFAPHYVPPPPTKENLEWADLAVVDMSKMNTPEGRAELVTVVRDAMHTNGFIYVVNHGLSQAQNERMVNIADVAFSQYESKPREVGYWRGYKLRQFFHIDNGVRDQIGMYSVHHQVDMQDHPQALQPYLPEIMAFNEYNHFKILFPILRLLALGLELPEDTLVNMHQFNGTNKTCHPYSEDDCQDVKGIWLMGHTDFTSISMLWSQPVSGLQVKSPDGTWRWVRHIPNALVVNAGEALEMLSGGFYKAAIHRVVQPPPDQRSVTRVGVYYFVVANDPVKLAPLTQSPVLQRLESRATVKPDSTPTMAEWMCARLKTYAAYPLPVNEDGTQEEEVMKGMFFRQHN